MERSECMQGLVLLPNLPADQHERLVVVGCRRGPWLVWLGDWSGRKAGQAHAGWPAGWLCITSKGV